MYEEIHTYQNSYIAGLKVKIQELQPKAEMWDDFLSSDGLITFTTLGYKFLGEISSQNVRGKMRDKGLILKKIDGTYQPTKKYKSCFAIVPYVIKENNFVKYNLRIKTSAVD